MRTFERTLIVVLTLVIGALVLPGTMCPTDVPLPGPTEIPIVYGNGSAGARVVTGDENWNDAADAPLNLQFTNLTIEAGASLQVTSGTTIRCTGKFVNNGTLIVRLAARGGRGESPENGGSTVTPQAGIAKSAAQAGVRIDTGNGVMVKAGFGAVGLSEFEARKIVTPALVAGGGGAIGGADDGLELGANGGGSLLVLAFEGIENNGAINADGQSGNDPAAGGGGGGGGIVILASANNITNAASAEITARGGAGEDGDTDESPSGGGGGGIIHLLAPEIVNEGTTDVSPGEVGGNWVQVTTSNRRAGGGGGASGGRGGSGVLLMDDGMPSETGLTEATSGFVFQSEFDPTALF